MKPAELHRFNALWAKAEERVKQEQKPKVIIPDPSADLDADGNEIEIGERYHIEEIDQIVTFDGNYLIDDNGEHFTEYLDESDKLKKVFAID